MIESLHKKIDFFYDPIHGAEMGKVMGQYKKCHGEEIVKNGWVRGFQRYKCKKWCLNFIEGDLRYKSLHPHNVNKIITK